MFTLSKLVTTLAVSIVLAAFAAPAHSAGGNASAGQRQVVLKYRSSDLASPAALERTYQHMSRAAEQVCQIYAGRDLPRQRVFQRCLTETLGAAVAAIQDPRLSALHDSRRSPIAVAEAPLRTARR